MGKGDKKTKRGKIANKSYGARRPRRIKKRPTVEEKIGLKKKV
jgi:30S ribosomal protein S31